MPDTRLHTCAACGALAEVALAAALYLWSAHPGAAAHTVFGADASSGVAVAAMVMTAVAVVVVVSGTTITPRHRWTVVLPVDTLAAGLAALAVGDLFASGDARSSGAWIFLLCAAVAMNAVSTRLVRSRSDGSDARGTNVADAPRQ